MRVLLTGAGGFVGSHVLRHLLTQTDWEIICPVTFRHQGLPVRIQSACYGSNPMEAMEYRARVHVVQCEMSAWIDNRTKKSFGAIDIIMNVASESHVDRSIEFPESFTRNNHDLMVNLLEYAREIRPRMFLQMSTDEVYGPAAPGRSHKEWDTILPSNPYSASKAAQEALAVAYWRTYGVPVIITNTMNIFGEMQDKEKFIPKIMRAVYRNESVPVHADANGRPGSRFYLHARNLADAWLWLVHHYAHGESGGPPMYGEQDVHRPGRWHIVGEREVDNLEMARMVATFMGRHLEYHYEDFHAYRPGHDLRYALDGTKLERAGWKPPLTLEESLRSTVEWTLKRPEWLS